MTRRWVSGVAHALCEKMGERDPELAIQALVSHRLSGLAPFAIPVNLEDIAEELGIDEIRVGNCPGAGYLFDDGITCWVTVNEQDDRRRQRFTIAHEFVHFMLPTYEIGSHVSLSAGQFERDQEEEYLCDLGASYILVPSDPFAELVQGKPVTARTIAYLSNHFDISLEAAIVTTCLRAESPLLVAKWLSHDEGYMAVERAYRGGNLGEEFWLDAAATVSPSHEIARLAKARPGKSLKSEFCLKNRGQKIYMSADYLSLGGTSSRVLAVFRPNSREKWSRA